MMGLSNDHDLFSQSVTKSISFTKKQFLARVLNFKMNIIKYLKNVKLETKDKCAMYFVMNDEDFRGTSKGVSERVNNGQKEAGEVFWEGQLCI